MRRALLDNITQERTGPSRPIHLSAPLGGLNTRDSIANMRVTDAPVLDNWFPRATEIIQRGGSTNYATGMTGSVRALATYSGVDGTNKLYGITNAGIYDITAGGVIGAVVQALTDGYWISINYTNSAGTTFLWGANGVDTPKMYNGAAWSTPAITGLLAPDVNADIVAPWIWKHRIFFTCVGSMNMYYLPIDAIQGTAAPFPLGNLFARGGAIVAGTSWTLDAGQGPDDLLVIMTDEGEIAVYSGTDPASASSFAIVGVYYVGKPVGRRCFTRLGADVCVLTENGVFALARLLKGGNINFASALSNKIQPSYVAGVQESTVTNHQGFESCVYPVWDGLLVNMPSSTSTAIQYVLNTITGAWCSFSGWNALCFIVFNDVLYFGTTSGIVRKAWDYASTIVSDNSSDIITSCHMAWSDFGLTDAKKKVALFRMLLGYSGTIDSRWGLSTDFSTPILSSFQSRAASTLGAIWDISPWDTSSWAVASVRYQIWRGVAHFPGYQLALWLQTAGNNGTLSWAGTDFVIEGGGIGI